MEGSYEKYDGNMNSQARNLFIKTYCFYENVYSGKELINDWTELLHKLKTCYIYHNDTITVSSILSFIEQFVFV